MFTKCLLSSPWSTFLLLFTLLIQLLSPCNGATYHSHDITSDTVCNRYHKRELSVSMSEPVVLETRPSTAEKLYSASALSCVFEVEAYYGYGVVSVVQKMNFRSNGDNCVDFIQTIYEDRDEDRDGMKLHKKKKSKKKKILKKVLKTMNNRRRRDSDYDQDERGPRICGDVLFGLNVDDSETMPPPFANPLPPTKPASDFSFFTEVQNPYQSLVSDASEVDHKGEIKTHLYISNRMLRVNEKVKMKVVYTAYQECDGRNVPSSLFHCGYGLCISRSLVNDGLVNCPFGDCIDEIDCNNAKSSNVMADVLEYEPTEEASAWMTVLWTLVILMLMALTCGGCCYYFIRKRRRN